MTDSELLDAINRVRTLPIDAKVEEMRRLAPFVHESKRRAVRLRRIIGCILAVITGLAIWFTRNR